MKITDQKNKKFGSVNLSGLFISEYLPGLGGNALKIYLTLVYYAKHEIKSDEQAIANVLGIDVSYVSAGLIELESKGLISREGSEIFLPDLIEKHIRDNYTPRTVPRTEASDDPSHVDRTHLLRAISDRFFGGQMSQTWYNDIVLWADTYGFCDEVVFMIFQQNKDKPYNRPYMKKVMESFGERGIRTVEQMNDWTQKREVYMKVRSKVASNLKISPLTVYQEKYIEKWFYEYGYGFDVIDLALREAAGMNKPSFNLYDTILTNWHELGLENAAAVKAHIAERRKNASSGQAGQGGNGSGGQGVSSGARDPKQGSGQGRRTKPGGDFQQRDYDSGFYDNIYGDGQ